MLSANHWYAEDKFYSGATMFSIINDSNSTTNFAYQYRPHFGPPSFQILEPPLLSLASFLRSLLSIFINLDIYALYWLHEKHKTYCKSCTYFDDLVNNELPAVLSNIIILNYCYLFTALFCFHSLVRYKYQMKFYYKKFGLLMM